MKPRRLTAAQIEQWLQQATDYARRDSTSVDGELVTYQHVVDQIKATERELVKLALLVADHVPPKP
jgi:hypothetical protein